MAKKAKRRRRPNSVIAAIDRASTPHPFLAPSFDFIGYLRQLMERTVTTNTNTAASVAEAIETAIPAVLPGVRLAIQTARLRYLLERIAALGHADAGREPKAMDKVAALAEEALGLLEEPVPTSIPPYAGVRMAIPVCSLCSGTGIHADGLPCACVS